MSPTSSRSVLENKTIRYGNRYSRPKRLKKLMKTPLMNDWGVRTLQGVRGRLSKALEIVRGVAVGMTAH